MMNTKWTTSFKLFILILFVCLMASIYLLATYESIDLPKTIDQLFIFPVLAPVDLLGQLLLYLVTFVLFLIVVTVIIDKSKYKSLSPLPVLITLMFFIVYYNIDSIIPSKKLKLINGKVYVENQPFSTISELSTALKESNFKNVLFTICYQKGRDADWLSINEAKRILKNSELNHKIQLSPCTYDKLYNK